MIDWFRALGKLYYPQMELQSDNNHWRHSIGRWTCGVIICKILLGTDSNQRNNIRYELMWGYKVPNQNVFLIVNVCKLQNWLLWLCKWLPFIESKNQHWQLILNYIVLRLKNAFLRDIYQFSGILHDIELDQNKKKFRTTVHRRNATLMSYRV